MTLRPLGITILDSTRARPEKPPTFKIGEFVIWDEHISGEIHRSRCEIVGYQRRSKVERAEFGDIYTIRDLNTNTTSEVNEYWLLPLDDLEAIVIEAIHRE